MRKLFREFSLTLFFCQFFLTLLAQNGVADKPVEMADRFRSEGKIYVVVATMVIILAGIIIYLLRTEGRLRRLERKD